MTARTLKITTPVITGTAYTAASGTTASSDTMTISATTAQGAIDFATLVILVANPNSTESAVLTLAAGTEYSSIGQGSKAITVATEATVIIGGQDFEGARFLSSGDTIVFTQAGTGPVTWTASQAPRATE
jgi:hypothetical protein